MNLTPLVFIALAAIIGLILGSWPIGLAVGLAVVVAASISAD